MPSATVAPTANVDDLRATARRLHDEGKLDVAARVLASIDAGPELDAMRADAWRAEPVTALRPVDLAFAKRVHDAFATKSFDVRWSMLGRAR